jgi:clan AA aspartic protease (TIGR02281 family)
MAMSKAVAPLVFAILVAISAGGYIASPVEGQPRVDIPVANAAITGHVQKPAVIAQDGPTEITRASDGLFYVNGRVNGQMVRFVVDTGATVVVLTPTDAARVGIRAATGGGTARIQTVSGTSAMQWVKLDQISIAGRHVSQIDAAIVHEGMKVSLLGQNALSELGPMTLDGDRLRFN